MENILDILWEPVLDEEAFRAGRRAMRERFTLYEALTARALEQADALTDANQSDKLKLKLRRLHHRLMQGPVRLLIVGASSSGKSTLVNALAGRVVSPEGQWTSTLVSAWIIGADQLSRKGPVYHVLQYLGEPENAKAHSRNQYLTYFCHPPGKRAKAEMEAFAVRVETQGGFLAESGITLLDTPGVGKDLDTGIGDQALLHAGVENIRVRFKSRYLSDPAAALTIANFARGLREKLRNDLTGALEPHIALGCPAGWTNDDRQRYAAIVGAAGFPNLHTVAESRAAFLYVHYDTDIGLSTKELAQPALVIDIGSSTTDFAYILDGKETEVGVFGEVYLGGGLLDQLILDDAVERSPRREQIQTVLPGFNFANYHAA